MTTPAPPEGFVLDSAPPPPSGFVIDSPEEEEAETQTALDTVKRLGEKVSTLETAAHFLTQAYGLPLSGLAGLFQLSRGDVEGAGKAIDVVQKVLIYNPLSRGGKELTSSATYPFQKLGEGAEFVEKKAEEAGYPLVGAIAKTGIESAPILIGGRSFLGKTAKSLPKINKLTGAAIKKGVNKALRPSVAGKATQHQIKQYYRNAENAVGEIIRNKDNLALVDETGAAVKGLPKTLDQFSQAIEQTKRNIFKEYDGLSKQADSKGVVVVDLSATGKSLEAVINNKVLRDMSPETVKYAKRRMKVMNKRENYTAVEAQEAIQFLNHTLKEFHRNPSLATGGKALVDSAIANNLRLQLDAAIKKATGKEYQTLKHKYGALKGLEKDVNHRAIVDARKNNKGLIDFSDVFTGYHVVQGMLSLNPVTIGASVGAKGIARYYKMLNDPNRVVKKMFSEVESLSKQKQAAIRSNR